MLSYHTIITVYVFTVVCSLAVLLMSIYVRKAPKSLWFSYMSLAIFIFTVGYYFEVTSLSETSAVTATKLQYIGTCYIAPFMLLFILEYCGKSIRKRYIGLMMVIPTITLILVQMWPTNMLYYKELVFITDTAVPYLRVQGAVFYYVFHLYMYCLSVAAVVVMLLFYRKSSTSVRKQSLTIVISIMIPVVGNAINIFKVSSWELNLTPIVLSITCVLLGYSVFKQGLYRIVPIAREQIVETMSDGFVLVDMQGRFVDANAAAMRLLPKLGEMAVGTRVDEFEDMMWLSDTQGQSEISVVNPITEQTQYHRVSRTLIRFKQQDICNCFMIFDITDAKQLLNKVSDMAERDSLTGLLNRGALYDKGWQLLQNVGGACLMMMDLDFFKKVNDQYGHLKGDEVLKETAATLNNCLRSTDLLARYGGEEFCALLPALDTKHAIELAERIRKRVGQCTYQSEQGEFHVTMSIGIARYSSVEHPSLEELVADADAALYAAKNAGRNTVVLAEETQQEQVF